MQKNKIIISTESTVDLPEAIMKQYDILSLPYHIIVGTEDLVDGVITNEELFTKVDALGTLPKTQAINQFAYRSFFEENLKSADTIIHFCLSSKLSSAYSNATLASQGLNVHVIDSLALSTGIALLVLKAAELAKEGKTAEEILITINKLIPKVQTSFLLDKTNYLYKGGRCSLLSFIAASVLSIKPQILMKDGKLEPAKKYRGSYEKATIKYVLDTLEQFNKPQLDRVFITCTTSPSELIDNVRTILLERGFKQIIETRAGCTISSHCGPNTIGILYFNDVDCAD